mmetsp:Transcript_46826/g.101903  ORF Transcript_46826/g.101903 Transcript_46826/m.101903 type:complete len:207 (-) Transcript_46826:1338-1958(-)
MGRQAFHKCSKVRIIPRAAEGVLPLRTVTALSLRHAHLRCTDPVALGIVAGNEAVLFIRSAHHGACELLIAPEVPHGVANVTLKPWVVARLGMCAALARLTLWNAGFRLGLRISGRVEIGPIASLLTFGTGHRTTLDLWGTVLLLVAPIIGPLARLGVGAARACLVLLDAALGRLRGKIPLSFCSVGDGIAEFFICSTCDGTAKGR